MKRLILLSVFVLTIVNLGYGQAETLISGDIDHGGFGGIATNFSQIDNNLGVMVGGYGAWLIDHTVAIGGGGYGLANNIKHDTDVLERDRYLDFGYGGIYLAYFHKSNKLVHLTLETFIGGGELNLRYNDVDDDDLINDDNTFVIDPHINVELNVTDYMRVIVGAGYRYVSGVDMMDYSNSDFSSPTANISVRFGAF